MGERAGRAEREIEAGKAAARQSGAGLFRAPIPHDPADRGRKAGSDGVGQPRFPSGSLRRRWVVVGQRFLACPILPESGKSRLLCYCAHNNDR